MKQVTAVNHKKLDTLRDLTGDYNKAVFLDRLIHYWYLHSKTKSTEPLWYPKTIAEIIADTQLSDRTISRYLRMLRQKGLIETKSRMDGVKKLYIRITQPSLDAIFMKT